MRVNRVRRFVKLLSRGSLVCVVIENVAKAKIAMLLVLRTLKAFGDLLNQYLFDYYCCYYEFLCDYLQLSTG